MDFEMLRKSVEFKGQVDEKRTFEGYAASYGTVDADNDIIMPGAFAAATVHPERIKVLWQHRDPIGKAVEMREDAQGLFVRGKVAKTRLGDEAIELMREGVIDRLSVGFNIPAGSTTWNDVQGVRQIHSGVLREFSLVTFPANEAAVITSVKELTPREIERVLREAGLSKTQAAAVANKGVHGLREAAQSEEEATAIINLLKTFKEGLKNG